MSPNRSQDPPPLPDFQRRIRLYRFQWVGLAVLALLPGLAMAGLLGDRRHAVHARGQATSASITFPPRLRYGQLDRIELRLHSSRPAAARILIDSAFAGRFSDIRAIPELDDAYAVHLDSLQPGGEQRVRIEIKGARYGTHRGSFTVATDADTLRIPLQVTVLP